MICFTEKTNSPLQPSSSNTLDTLRKKGEMTPQAGSKLHVRFAPCIAEVVGTVPSRWTLSDTEIRNSWCSDVDLERFRVYAKYFASDVLTYDKMVVDKMDDAYSTAMHMAMTVSEDDLPRQLQELSRKKTRSLNDWAAIGYSRRGLERLVSQKQKAFRGDVHKQTRDIVANYQKLKRSRSCPLTNPTCCKDSAKEDALVDQPEQLRKLCQDISRPSRIFARMMGQADSDAVLKYYNIQRSKKTEERPKRRLQLQRSHSERGSFGCDVGEKESSAKVITTKTGANERVPKIVSRPSLHGSRSASSRSLLSPSRTIFETS